MCIPDDRKTLEQRCPFVSLPKFSDERGTLSVWDSTNEFFPFQRVFWFYDVPDTANRGGHAHRTCRELVTAISGSFEVELFDGISTMNVLLNDPAVGLIIPEYVWCRLHHFSKNAVGLCLASESYQPEGYIHNIEEFIEVTARIKNKE